MPLTYPVTEIIGNRRSCRHFSAQPLSAVHQNQLLEYIARQAAPPFGSQPRFVLVQADDRDSESLRGLGTYGFIKGARAYLVGLLPVITAAEVLDHEDFGFALEEIILFATGRGWGTCWLGASFTRSRFADKAGAREDEWIPAITPIGYPAEYLSNRERLLRWSIKAHRRKAWADLFFVEDGRHPLSPEEAGAYRQALEMVRLGPSGSNAQPWRLVREKDANTFHFFIHRGRAYQANRLIKADIQRLDIGIAMCHFQLTARENGRTGSWTRCPAAVRDVPVQWEYRISWNETATADLQSH